MDGDALDIALRQVQRLFDREQTDGQLLDSFRTRHDEGAFGALLRRHGPMVLRVCRRVLPRNADAEDAFQATFLLLARKAGTIRKHDSVASWLHGAAHRLAVQLRKQDVRRQQREQAAGARPAPAGGAEAAWRELQEVLDEELARLPDKYRAPLLLCYLEGKTHEEAARQLGWPVGTVAGRLHRAREQLRERLGRRGLTSPSLMLGLSLAVLTAPQAVPAALASQTLTASLRLAAGEAASAVARASVAALVEGATQTMKLKITLALALLVGTGMTLLGVTALPRPEARTAAGAQAEKERAAGAGKDALGDPLPPGARMRLGTARLNPISQGFTSPVFSPDGKKVASLGAGGAVLVWSVKDGKLAHRLAGTGDVRGVRFTAQLELSADGKTAFILSGANAITQRDLATGKTVRTFTEAGGALSAFALSPDGKRLAAPAASNRVRVWDVASGKSAALLEGHTQAVRAVAFSPDGKRLVSGGADGTTRLWDVEKGKAIRTVPTTRGNVLGVAFSRDGKSVASASSDETVRVWDAGTGKETARGPFAGGGTRGTGTVELFFLPGDRRLAIGGQGGISLWDVAKGEEVRGPGRGGDFTRHALSPDGKVLASLGTQSRVLLADAATGKSLVDFEGHDGAVLAVAVSAGGVIATASQDRTVRLWDAKTGKTRRVLTGHLGPVNRLAFSHDGKRLATAGSGFNDQTVSVWGVETGREENQVRLGRGQLQGLAFTPDGKDLLLMQGFTGTQVYSLKDDKVRKELRTVSAPVVFTPDGKQFAIAPVRGGKVKFYDVAKMEEVREIGVADEGAQFTAGLNGMSFTPDGKLLVTAWFDGRLNVHDVATGKRVRSARTAQDRTRAGFGQGRGPVLRGDGRVAAVADAAGHVVLVELATGLTRANVDTTQGSVQGLAVGPDGRTLVTAGADGTALVWDLYELPVVQGGPAPDEAALAALWGDLGGKDGEKAGRALRSLALAPKQAVPYLVKQLTAARPAEKGEVTKLVAALDSDDFKARKKAEEELAKLGEAARGALEAGLKAKPSLDATRRIQALLKKLGEAVAPPEVLRALRGVEALERMGTAEAKSALEKLSQGAAEAVLTREAQAALGRLKKG